MKIIALSVIVILCLTSCTSTPESVPEVELTGTRLAAIIAVLTSVILSSAPKFRQWWESYPHKRESLAGVGFVLAWVLVGLHYAGALDLGIGAFGWPVVWRVIEAWLAYTGAGQLAYTAKRWGQ